MLILEGRKEPNGERLGRGGDSSRMSRGAKKKVNGDGGGGGGGGGARPPGGERRGRGLRRPLL